MTKTYSNKSNAIRAFKTLHAELAGVLTNAAIVDQYIRFVPVGDGTSISGPSGWAWAIVIPEGVKVIKRHIYKGVQFRRRSVEPEGITSMVHEMFDEYQADAEEANKVLTRKQMIARAVKDGVAYYTARTQYQKWLRG